VAHFNLALLLAYPYLADGFLIVELLDYSVLSCFNIWCSKKGTHAGKLRQVIADVQQNLINNGFRDELNACIQPIEYICKKIVDFWMRYKRKKSYFTI